jgi:hypothetical protein
MCRSTPEIHAREVTLLLTFMHHRILLAVACDPAGGSEKNFKNHQLEG